MAQRRPDLFKGTASNPLIRLGRPTKRKSRRYRWSRNPTAPTAARLRGPSRPMNAARRETYTWCRSLGGGQVPCRQASSRTPHDVCPPTANIRAADAGANAWAMMPAAPRPVWPGYVLQVHRRHAAKCRQPRGDTSSAHARHRRHRFRTSTTGPRGAQVNKILA